MAIIVWALVAYAAFAEWRKAMQRNAQRPAPAPGGALARPPAEA